LTTSLLTIPPPPEHVPLRFKPQPVQSPKPPASLLLPRLLKTDCGWSKRPTINHRKLSKRQSFKPATQPLKISSESDVCKRSDHLKQHDNWGDLHRRTLNHPFQQSDSHR